MRFFRSIVFISITFLLGCNDASKINSPSRGSNTGTATSKTSVAQLPKVPLLAQPLAETKMSGADSTLFREVPSSQSGVDFQLRLPDPLKWIKDLMFLTPFGGIATGDFNGDGLADFYVTSPEGAGRLYQNTGELRFRDVTSQSGVDAGGFWGTGATFVDIDNDGDLDLYVCGYLMPNKLFINEGADASGDVQFVDRAKEYGLDYDGASMTMAFADMDNDGDLDCYLATTTKAPPPETKFQVRFENGKPIVLEKLREYWELVYLPGDRAKRVEAGQYDHLFRNDGGKFVDVSKQAGIDGPYFTLSATWWDYNGDNLPDIYVSNDYTGPDKLYKNLGNGKFENVIAQVIPHTPWFSMGSDLGDFNNDGFIDFLATDMSATSHYRDKVMMGNMEDSNWFLDFPTPRQYMRNAVYLNIGTSRVMEAAFLTGLARSDWTWNPRIADFDNDGRLDLFVTNGILRDGMNSDLTEYAKSHFDDGSPEWAKFWAAQKPHPEVNHAYRNVGDLHFEPVEKSWGLDRLGVSFGAASADFDKDGDIDLVVNNADAPMSVYENRSAEGRRIVVRLCGRESNRFGLGATVRITLATGQQVQYMTQTRGWLSSCDPMVHFGLGTADKIEELSVLWPSGIVQEFESLEANMLYTITEPKDGLRFLRDVNDQLASKVLLKASAALSSFKHDENEFNDFEKQPLLPNRLSRDGPALACGDIDGDGIDDFYLGGSRNQTGQVLVSDSSSKGFAKSNQQDLVSDAMHEDVDAIFFDADGDQDLDLYVVSGSNEWDPGDDAYRDRLYLNDGAGTMTRASQESLPDVADSGSTVAAGDVDGDGDLDLFVGSRYVPGSYPTPGKSRLLINEGGRFTEREEEAINNAGLITDAEFVDIDGDKQLDLVFATEWGPVRILLNKGEEFVDITTESGIAESTGWWTSVTPADVDNDGDSDFVVGNFGFNTKYKASAEKPELLYYGVFDDSGNAQIVEAKYVNGECLPRRGFSCSRNAMPFLNKKMKTFHNFASANLEELYTPKLLNQAQKLEANTLASGVVINQGKGKFEFRELPNIAQISPCLDSAAADLNGDGIVDLILAQNFYAPQVETGRMDGGVGLVLLGQGDGQFEPLFPYESGLLAPFDSRQVQVSDLNRDGRLDVVIATNDGPLVAFEANSSAEFTQTITTVEQTAE